MATKRVSRRAMVEWGRESGQPLLLGFLSLGFVSLWLRFNAPASARGLQHPADLLHYFHPLTEYASARLRAGELPLWNPHACSGIPLLATWQVGVFHPGLWLAVLLPAELAIPVRLALECALGGLFAALLFRSWGLGVLASGFGGLLFIYACLLGQSFWPPEVSTILWIPWLLLCIEKLAQRWHWGWWGALAGGAALQWLAGFPQFVLYGYYLVLPYACLRVLGAPRTRGDAARLLGIASAIALALGIAAVQLIPSAELVLLGNRDVAMTAIDVHYLGSAPSAEPMLRNAFSPEVRLGSFDYGRGAGYLGVTALLLACVGLFAGRREARTWWLVVAGILALVLSNGFVGATRPLYEAYAALPTAGWFRTPERFRVLYLFAAITLAATGLHQASAGFRELTGGRSRVVVLGLVAGMALVAALIGSPGIGWRLGVCLALLGVLAFASSAWLRRGAQLGMALFVIVDLALATGPYGSLRSLPVELNRTVHWVGRTLMTGEAFAAVVERAGLDRMELVARPREGLGATPLVGSGPLAGGYRLSCYEPLLPAVWSELHERLDGAGPSGFEMSNHDPMKHPMLYDLTSVRWIASFRWRDTGTDPKQRVEALVALSRDEYGQGRAPSPEPLPGVAYELVENRDALPRAYLSGWAEYAPAESVLERVAQGDPSLRRRVLIDEGGRKRGAALPAREESRVEAAEILDYAPEHVEIATDATDAAILVLTDTYYPGWTATLDGSPVEILRANGMHRAVRVPPGPHRVVFEYRPISLRIGAALSVLSLGALVGIPWWGRRATSKPSA